MVDAGELVQSSVGAAFGFGTAPSRNQLGCHAYGGLEVDAHSYLSGRYLDFCDYYFGDGTAEEDYEGGVLYS